MIILVIITSIVAIISLLALISGTMLHDIRQVTIEKSYRRHPYARRWRKRPLVSIVIDGEPSTKCLASIRRSNYRKIEIVPIGQPVSGELVLSLDPNIVFEQTAISNAVRQLTNRATQSQVEIIPILQSPQTSLQFFRLYRRVASTPFVAARTGLGIMLPRSPWPTLVRAQPIITTRKDRIYQVLSQLTLLANLCTLLSITYIAVVLYQPELLLLYISAFGLWLAMAIWSQPSFTLGQKITYLLLAPASLGYFALLLSMTPLVILRRQIGLPFAARTRQLYHPYQ